MVRNKKQKNEHKPVLKLEGISTRKESRPSRPQTALSDQPFSANVSIEDLLANVKPLDDPSVLIGGIPPDENIDELE